MNCSDAEEIWGSQKPKHDRFLLEISFLCVGILVWDCNVCAAIRLEWYKSVTYLNLFRKPFPLVYFNIHLWNHVCKTQPLIIQDLCNKKLLLILKFWLGFYSRVKREALHIDSFKQQ